MLKSMSVDVWVAPAIAIVDIIAWGYGLGPTSFVATYVAVCGYVLVETFGDELG